MTAAANKIVKAEFEAAKARLSEYERAGVVVLLDPRKIRLSTYANRHESSFQSAEFAEFKADIAEAGGNLVPIKVRRIHAEGDAEELYEAAYGHRRHRATLELGLPVRAIIAELTDEELFREMDHENRGRASLSAWEQGAMYLNALKRGLFPNQRIMAAKLGVSMSRVSMAIAVGSIQQEVIGSFATPTFLTYRAGGELVKALEDNQAAVLERAAALVSLRDRPRDEDVLAHLLGRKSLDAAPARAKPAQPPAAFLLGETKVGQAVTRGGKLNVKFAIPALDESRTKALLETIQTAIAKASK
jgi:ParB family chromosome partitioning protein